MAPRDHNVSAHQPKVAVVVLTWNGRALTLDCLDSLTAVTYDNMDIIVVDNASTDGTAGAVAERFGGRVTVIVNDTNLGFSAGNNVGIRRALQDGADYVLLLNNDTSVDAGLIGALVGAFGAHPNAGITGPKIYYADPADQIWFAGGEIFLARGTARHIGIRETDRGQYDRERQVDYVTGCALMTRREVFEAIGYLDEHYNAYFEDADFCMRAKRHGYGVWYEPRGQVWHKISSSTGGQLGARKVRRKLRSAVRFYGRYASPHHWLTIPLFFALDVLRILLLVLTGRIRDAEGENTTRERNA